MLKPGMRVWLLGLCLIGPTALPAAAQSWPSDSGPSGDYLGSTVRQFERLGPPPVEEGGRGERVIPDMPITDVPGGSVDVGLPALVSAPLVPSSAASRRTPRQREVGRRARGTTAAAPRPRGREAELIRELRDRDRQIENLRRQLDGNRQSSSESRGAGGGVFGVNPASAATVTPR